MGHNNEDYREDPTHWGKQYTMWVSRKKKEVRGSNQIPRGNHYIS
jgi:hypothetical protein